MPVQQQMSSFAGRLGNRVAQANLEHKDKPIDVGNRRLPPGIKNGRAKLQFMYTKHQTEENSKIPKGEIFFRASAVVEAPESVNGQKIVGMTTSVVIPLCDIPAKGNRKAESFSDNWYQFQNLFKLLGVNPPNETGTDDAAAKRIEAYYFAAMKALTDPRKPVYIEFSTRGWTPPKTPLNPNPEELTFETWHGLSQLNTNTVAHNPATAVVVQDHFEEPPTGRVVMPDENTNSSNHTQSLEEEVEALVQVAVNDPEGNTDEGALATQRLEEMAWSNGWDENDTANAENWHAVGTMALNQKEEESQQQEHSNNAPPLTMTITPGYKAKFVRRTKEGAKLKNAQGVDLPAQEVEVVSVNQEAKTCTVKTVRDGKDVLDIRTKQPIQVKWEWLE